MSAVAHQEDDFDILLELTAQLQLQDIEEWRASQKGKGRVGDKLSDIELSFNAMEVEYKATLQSLTDRRIAQGTSRAATEDEEIIEAIAAIEAQEQMDRQYALELSVNPNAAPPSHIAQDGLVRRRSESTTSNETASRPASVADSLGSFAKSFTSTSSRTSGHGSVRNSYASTNATKFVPSILKLQGGRHTADCVICSEPATQAYQAPCGCFYDRDCLTELFQKATVDESLFPPRCCSQQISFQVVRSVFSPQLVRTFEQKAEEFKTTNRLYCHGPTCSTFIGPAVESEREKANKQCTQCSRHTCSFCKGTGHASYIPCPTDTAAQQVLALGRQEGWQSCPSCHNMVELDVGCYHMTCRCRHEFCYLCAQQWKNCTCPQWDEDRLVAQAERRAVRELGALPQAARPVQIAHRAQEVERLVEALRENHDCAHHRFGFVKRNASGNCESCGNWLRDFLLHCRGCSIQVCVRCRRNRL